MATTTIMETDSNIRRFYARKCVALTAATGIVGKVLLENLLRTCPEIDTIYVFVRAKKGEDPGERTRTLLSGILFDAIRKSNPKFASKVKTLPADLTSEQFGLSEEIITELQQRCHIVFHSAASVAFTDPLPFACGNCSGGQFMISVHYLKLICFLLCAIVVVIQCCVAP